MSTFRWVAGQSVVLMELPGCFELLEWAGAGAAVPRVGQAVRVFVEGRRALHPVGAAPTLEGAGSRRGGHHKSSMFPWGYPFFGRFAAAAVAAFSLSTLLTFHFSNNLPNGVPGPTLPSDSSFMGVAIGICSSGMLASSGAS